MDTAANIPIVPGRLRKSFIQLPSSIWTAGGIRIMNRHIRAILFSTDVAIIRNTDADAVIAVYPFTPQPVITQAIITVSDIPVFCGVGGGKTTGLRTRDIAIDADFQGAHGVVVNAPVSNDVIRELKDRIEVPVIVTVVSASEDVAARLEAGADILNVSGARMTPEIVRRIRDVAPDIPIIATGGPTEESILEVIAAGANAVTYTPPTSADLFKARMEQYRKEAE